MIESLPLGLVRLYASKRLYISINRGQGKSDHCQRLEDEYFLAILNLEGCIKDPKNTDQVTALSLELLDCYGEIPSELKKQNGTYLLEIKDLAKVCDEEDLVADRRVKKVLVDNS